MAPDNERAFNTEALAADAKAQIFNEIPFASQTALMPLLSD